MGLMLPAAKYVTQNVRILSSRNDMRSATGTHGQRIARGGSHHIGEFELEPMPIAEAREWFDIETEADTVIAPIDQTDFPVGNPGAPQISVSGQLGNSLPLKGLTAGYLLRKGQPLSVITAGRRFVYIIGANATASSGGTASVTLKTSIRHTHLNNDVVEVAEPKIEGFPVVDPSSWLQDGDGHVRVKFTVEEP